MYKIFGRLYDSIPDVIRLQPKGCIFGCSGKSIAWLKAHGIDIEELPGKSAVEAAKDGYIAAIQAAYAAAGVEFALDVDGLPPGAGQMQAALGGKLSAAEMTTHTLAIVTAWSHYVAVRNGDYVGLKGGG